MSLPASPTVTITLPTSGAVDVTATTQRISIRHGRDRMFDSYLPGSATITFLDFTGDWNPANTSGPYYGELTPMRQVDIATTYQSVNYPLYSGFITSWDYSWADPSVDYSIVTLSCVDGFRLLSLANVDNVPGASANDLPGERIEQVLDAVGWPAGKRNIDLGDTLLANDPGGIRSALQVIQNVELCELGAFFIDHEGNATFYSRQTLSELAGSTPIYFDDEGLNVQYQGIDVAFDEQELANQVTFVPSSGTAQTASDPTSISNYFLRSFYKSDLYINTNPTTLARATAVLNYRKQVRMRIDSLTLDLSSDSSRIIPGLSLEIGDPIVVDKNIAGGTGVDLRLTIQGHQDEITPDRWIKRFSTAYPLSTAFILGSTEYGILGTNTL